VIVRHIGDGRLCDGRNGCECHGRGDSRNDREWGACGNRRWALVFEGYEHARERASDKDSRAFRFIVNYPDIYHVDDWMGLANGKNNIHYNYGDISSDEKNIRFWQDEFEAMSDDDVCCDVELTRAYGAGRDLKYRNAFDVPAPLFVTVPRVTVARALRRSIQHAVEVGLPFAPQPRMLGPASSAYFAGVPVPRQ